MNKDRHPFRKSILLLLSLALGGLSLAIVSLIHYRDFLAHGTSQSAMCNISATVNCDAVNASEWSSLFGIPVALYGCIFYIGFLFVLLLFYRSRRPNLHHTLLILTIVGGLISLVLFSVSFQKIGVLCPFCIGVYAINLLLLVVAFFSGADTPLRVRLLEGVRSLLMTPRLLFVTPKGVSANETFAGRVLFIGLIASIFAVLNSLPEKRRPLPMAIDSTSTGVKGTHQGTITALPPEQASADDIAAWRSSTFDSIYVVGGDARQRDFVKNPDGVVEIVEFSDFECPACHSAFTILETLSMKFGEKLRIVHKNFPLDQACNPHLPGPLHMRACLASTLARCAGEHDKFWEAAHALFDLDLSGAASDASVIAEVAGKIGETETTLTECIESNRHLPKIQQDIEQAVQLQITGTPTLWINRRRFRGRVTEATLSEIIQGELDRLQS